jgi:hypothetical protein
MNIHEAMDRIDYLAHKFFEAGKWETHLDLLQVKCWLAELRAMRGVVILLAAFLLIFMVMNIVGII